MAESQSGFDLESFEKTLDSGLSGVMPETWLGHGRLVIADSDLSDKQKTFAYRLMGRLAESNPEAPTKVLAEKSKEKAIEKLN